MKIYPAIDIKSGVCVRLTQGDYDQVTIYQQDPLAQAKLFAAQGARNLHVVDLDGAKQGQSVNFAIISRIAQETTLQIQTGGGIRTEQQIKNAFEQGINRIVIGSMAISQSQLVKRWLKEFGAERIVLALDVRIDDKNIPKLAMHGWQTASEVTLWQLLDEYQSVGLQHVLCTDIGCDGTLQGPNFTLYQQCVARYPDLAFQASGGISCLNDVHKLAEVPVAGVIIGKALYENRFSLSDVINKV